MTGLTYNGVALTKIGPTIDIFKGYTSLWYLLNPATGTHNIVVTKSGGTQILKIAAASYTGVRQTSQPDLAANKLQIGGTLTMSLTPPTPASWMVMAAHGDGPIDTFAPNANTIMRNVNQNVGFFDNGGPTNGATTLSVFQPHGADGVGGFILALAPDTDATPPPPVDPLPPPPSGAHTRTSITLDGVTYTGTLTAQ
jgi:hypothetical protein